MALKKGDKRGTTYDRTYEVLAGPFASNDAYINVYTVRDGHDGVVRLMGEKFLENLPEVE